MPKRRVKKRQREERFSRTVTILSSRVTVRQYVVTSKGVDPHIGSQPWLEIRGAMDDPVRDVRDVVISIYPEDSLVVGTARPAAIGAIIGVRPALKAVIPFGHVEFDRMWTLALSGELKYGYLAFTKPHYNTALVTSVSFSNEKEE